jgi:hypothetical protein
MTATAAWRHRRAVALVTVALAVVLAGCSTSSAGGGVVGPGSFSATPAGAGGVSVVMRFGDRAITATLGDTPEAQQFAAMLPATVELTDVWGQAKSGRLPQTITVEGGRPIHDPVPGDIYFWPQTAVIAIYYDDLGQAVPDPGLVRLGTVVSGLAALGDAGKQFTVRIEATAAINS